MTDPYARVNERIDRDRHARGLEAADAPADLFRRVSDELGATTEAALGLVVDVTHHLGLRFLEEATRAGGSGRLAWSRTAVRAALFAASRMPTAGGRITGTSSQWALETGFSVLQALRRSLQQVRRTTGGASSRPAPPPETFDEPGWWWEPPEGTKPPRPGRSDRPRRRRGQSKSPAE